MEQICFELENVEVTYLDKEVLKIDRLAVHQFDRIGIVRKNGAGIRCIYCIENRHKNKFSIERSLGIV